MPTSEPAIIFPQKNNVIIVLCYDHEGEKPDSIDEELKLGKIHDRGYDSNANREDFDGK